MQANRTGGLEGTLVQTTYPYHDIIAKTAQASGNTICELPHAPILTADIGE